MISKITHDVHNHLDNLNLIVNHMSEILKNLIIETTKKEYQKLLKKWSSTYSEEEKELVNFGLIPVPTTNNSFLGTGKYAKAYEVLWKGKHVVAKITTSKKDIDAIEKLNNLKDDKRISKNILKVYDKFSLGIDANDVESWCIVVEYLIPLSQQIKDDIFGENELSQYNKEKQDSIKFEDIKNAIENSYKHWKQKLIDPTQLETLFSSKIFNNFVIAVFNQINQFHDEKRKIVSNIEIDDEIFSDKTIIQLFKETIGLLEINEDIKYFSTSVYIDLNNTITDLFINRKRFPINSRNSESYKSKLMLNHPDPRIKSLMKTLLILKNDYNINWIDLHGENIMMRPKTREFVISDPGLFEF